MGVLASSAISGILPTRSLAGDPSVLTCRDVAFSGGPVKAARQASSVLLLTAILALAATAQDAVTHISRTIPVQGAARSLSAERPIVTPHE